MAEVMLTEKKTRCGGISLVGEERKWRDDGRGGRKRVCMTAWGERGGMSDGGGYAGVREREMARWEKKKEKEKLWARRGMVEG